MEAKQGTKKGKGIWIALIICLLLAALGILFLILKPTIQYHMTMSKADRLLEGKQFEEAIEAYEKASKIKVSSNEAEERLYDAYLAWAKRQIEDGEYKDAIRSAKEALYIKKNDKAYDVLFDARLGLAEKYFKDEKYSKAKEQVNAVLSKDPENERALALSNQIYEKTVLATQVKPIDDPDPTDPPVVQTKRTEITMWTTIPETDASYHALQEAISEMASEYPDVVCNIESENIYEYKSKIKAAVTNGEVPDIFFCPTGDFLEDFENAGCVRPLDDFYRQYENMIQRAALSPVTRNGRLYGIPTTYNAIVMFANMDVLASVGYDHIPETYNELMECCAALKEQGIVPFACAGSEIWCITEYVETMMIKTIGADALSDLFRCRKEWNDKGIVDAVNVFLEMRELGYIEGEGSYNDQAQDLLMHDAAAFYISGSWNSGMFSYYGNGNIAVGEFPVLNAEASEMGELIGGPDECLCVSSRSQYPDVAAEYAFELARRLSHYEALDGCGIPAFYLYGDTSSFDPLSRQAIDLCMQAKAFVPFGDCYIYQINLEEYLNAYIGLFEGEVSADEFVDYLVDHCIEGRK